MKLQDVILKALAKKLTWIEAAEIAGMSVRNMQRMRRRQQPFIARFDEKSAWRNLAVPVLSAWRAFGGDRIERELLNPSRFSHVHGSGP